MLTVIFGELWSRCACNRAGMVHCDRAARAILIVAIVIFLILVPVVSSAQLVLRVLWAQMSPSTCAANSNKRGADSMSDALEVAMAPTAGKKLPKVVQTIQAQLAGQKLTPDLIRARLSSKGYNNCANSFRASLSPEQKSEYKSKTKQEREAWLCQWAIDPVLCANKGFNSTVAYTDDSSVADDEWVIESVLGGPRFLNNPEHATIVVEGGELEERPCKLKSLAARGVMEYRMTREFVRYVAGLRGEAGLRSEADLKADEAAEVSDSLKAASISTDLGKRQPKRPAAKAKVEDAGAKELKQANAKFQASLRQIKKKSDTITADLTRVGNDLPKLFKKGYPETMMEFMQEKMDSVHDNVKEAKELYAKHVFKAAETSVDKTAEVLAFAKELDAATATMHQAKITFDKQYGGDLRNLTA